MQVVERKGIELNFKRSLVEVKPDKREAVFQVLEEDRTETSTKDYEQIAYN